MFFFHFKQYIHKRRKNKSVTQVFFFFLTSLFILLFFTFFPSVGSDNRKKSTHTHTPQKGDISKEMYTDTQRETVIIVYVCVPQFFCSIRKGLNYARGTRLPHQRRACRPQTVHRETTYIQTFFYSYRKRNNALKSYGLLWRL